MTYDINNIFAKIIRGELPCKKIYEDTALLAFHDINPSAPCHVLVIPKKEYLDFSDFTARASKEEVADFFIKVKEIAELLGLKNGFRLVTNKGEDGGQIVPHFHVHILGGKSLGSKVN